MADMLLTAQGNAGILGVLLALALGICLLFVFGWRSYQYGEILVSDGDGLRLPGRNGERGVNMRLDGFDAPEWNQPGGKEASDHLRALIKDGVKFKRVGTCVYGRPIIYAKVRGTFLGMKAWRDVAVLMCAAGHGHTTSAFYTPRGFAMLRARIMHRGLWKNAGLFGWKAVDPKEWRKADNAIQAQRRNIHGATSSYGLSRDGRKYQSAPRFKPKRAMFPRDLL